MHRIATALFTLALGLGTATLAHAQDTQPAAPQAVAHKAPNPQHQAKELSKKLGLSPDQTAQIAPIFADRDQRVQTLMANTSLDPKTMHQQRRAIMADTDQKLNAILTPAQQQQYATLKAERHHKGETAPTPPAATL